MSRVGFSSEGTAQLCLAGLVLLCGACAPDVEVGQFRCNPESEESICPPGYDCLPLGSSFTCSPWRASEQHCGNGVLDPGEECDWSAGRAEPCFAFGLHGTAECNPDCTVRCGQYVCGDGVIEGDEQCDDGNPLAGDGCDETCQPEELTWVELLPVLSPPARSGHGMAYDEASGHVVLFGGESMEGTALRDTWLFDGTNWTELELPDEEVPTARYDHAMAYDRERGVMVVYGGQGPQGVLGDTWEFDGSSWHPAPTAPRALYGAVMAHSPGEGLLVAGGFKTGFLNQSGTWLYDGAWETLFEHYPWGRAYSALTGSRDLDYLVLHGGADRADLSSVFVCSETWRWSDGGWTLLDSEWTAPERWGHAMAYFGRWDKMVVFGGAGPRGERRGETWAVAVIEGRAPWYRVPTTHSPAARWHHRMVVDAARERIVLFGGEDDIAVKNDTWVVE